MREYVGISFGPPSQKQLVLLYNDGHYNVITSLPGFFGTSYFCTKCLKPYDNQGHHACDNNPDHCSACLQTGCPDYTKAQGRCGYVTCPSCHHYVEALLHRCFIQVAKTPEEERAERRAKRRPGRRLRGAAAGLATVHSNEDDVPSTSLLPSPPADGVDLNDEKPLLHVFFDVEAMQDTGRHVPNLVVAETENDERPVRFRGDSCMRDFLEWLDTLTEEDSREVKVLAHNFQGYDGYFVVEEYHRQHRIVQQLRNGAKLLQVTFDRITFIDSLSFFQMPLSAFPKTFGLTELKKGYFPHLFNTLSNQSYIGRIPDTSYFMPDCGILDNVWPTSSTTSKRS